ncbi:piggyBac transposable element-derived protein 4 [Trichonephila clavipes]|nr:piggyBac transposable element-derived protein 4 [Trichonephila clavipes]
MMDSESESEDSEFNISNSEDDSSDLSTDDIFSESSESEDDDVSSARIYVKIKKLKKGETVAFRRGKALILKWKDKKDVSLISTIHNSEVIAVRSSREEKLKPKIVVDYNDTMGGVDRADQNLASYAIPRKYGKKYYRKIFFHIFDQFIWNSYVLYKKIGGSKSQLQFRLDLVNEMVIKYHSESIGSKRAARGLLVTDFVILNHGQVTWTTPELAPPLLTITPHQREDVSALDRFNVHHCPTRRVFSGTGLELVTRQATIRYLYHSATAAPSGIVASSIDCSTLGPGKGMDIHKCIVPGQFYHNSVNVRNSEDICQTRFIINSLKSESSVVAYRTSTPHVRSSNLGLENVTGTTIEQNYEIIVIGP